MELKDQLLTYIRNQRAFKEENGRAETFTLSLEIYVDFHGPEYPRKSIEKALWDLIGEGKIRRGWTVNYFYYEEIK